MCQTQPPLSSHPAQSESASPEEVPVTTLDKTELPSQEFLSHFLGIDDSRSDSISSFSWGPGSCFIPGPDPADAPRRLKWKYAKYLDALVNSTFCEKCSLTWATGLIAKKLSGPEVAEVHPFHQHWSKGKWSQDKEKGPGAYRALIVAVGSTANEPIKPNSPRAIAVSFGKLSKHNISAPFEFQGPDRESNKPAASCAAVIRALQAIRTQIIPEVIRDATDLQIILLSSDMWLLNCILGIGPRFSPAILPPDKVDRVEKDNNDLLAPVAELSLGDSEQVEKEKEVTGCVESNEAFIAEAAKSKAESDTQSSTAHVPEESAPEKKDRTIVFYDKQAKKAVYGSDLLLAIMREIALLNMMGVEVCYHLQPWREAWL